MSATPGFGGVPQARRPVPSDLAQAHSVWAAYLDQLEQALTHLDDALESDQPPTMPTLLEPVVPLPLVLMRRSRSVDERLQELTRRLSGRRDEVQRELAALPRQAAGSDQRRTALASLGNRVDLSG